MAFAVPPPDPMKVGSQLEESWISYKSDLEIYMQATGQDELDSKQKAGLLLAYMGREAKQLIANWNFDATITKSYELLIQAIDRKIKPKCYPIVNRLLFRQRTRRPNEEIEDYYTELMKLCEGCDFEETEAQHMMIDNMVDSIQEHDLKQICMKDLSLKTAETLVEKIKDYEKLREASNQLTDKNGKTIHHISSSNSKHQSNYQPYYQYHQYHRQPSRNSRSRSRTRSRSRSRSQSNSRHHQRSRTKSRSRSKSPGTWNRRHASPAPENFKKKPCRRCQTRHPFGQCPAEGYQCSNCRKMNHFTKCCTSVSINSISVQTTSEDSFNLIHHISVKPKRRGWYEVLQVCAIPINFKLDPGSDVNTLSLSLINKLNVDPKLILSTVTARGYTNFLIETVGVISLPVKCRGIQTNLEFVITKHDDVPVLCVETCEDLGLAMFIPPSLSPKIRAINKPDCDKPNSDNPDFDNPKSVEPNSVTTQDETSQFIKANQDLFEGFGTFPDIVTLMIDKKVQPTRKPPRRLPAVISTKLQDALKKSEEASIIEKCEMPETWVSNMLIREKSDGSLRICLDPKDLNEAIQRPFFEIPTPQHIQTKLSNNAVFTVLDLKNGFLVTFRNNEEVYILHGNTWQPAKVVQPNSTPKSYVVQKDGRELVRTNRHMMPIMKRLPGPEILTPTQPRTDSQQEQRRAPKRRRLSPEEPTRRSKRVRIPNRKYLDF